REPRALPELPAERVLAAPAADHEDPHAPSVPEVAHAGEDHRGAAGVGGADDLLVARAATRLDDGGGARLERLLEAIGEREEGTAAHHRGAERDTAPLGGGALLIARLHAR